MKDILRLVNYVKIEIEPDDNAARLKEKIELGIMRLLVK